VDVFFWCECNMLAEFFRLTMNLMARSVMHRRKTIPQRVVRILSRYDPKIHPTIAGRHHDRS
jgi:hypothetical protein